MQQRFFDAHVHWNFDSKEKIELANAYGAHCLSINTEAPSFPPLEEQEKIILYLKKEAKVGLHHMCSFSMKKWGEPDWADSALEQIKKGMEKGARGIKIWKNIGMDASLKKEDGSFLMIDDDALNPIFEYAIANDILVIGHQGEPKNCWLPLDEMTVQSDRDYFGAHPRFHMYHNPDYPSYEQQIIARDRLLKKFPKLRFVGLHLLSLEWNLYKVAKRLDEHTSLMTDLAERICHVQLAATKDWTAVRDFFMKYQDRIIYGTDVIDDGSLPGSEFAKKVEELWQFHWEFFSTDNEMTAPEFSGTFRGLNLPEQVLDKLFYSNAMKTYLNTTPDPL